MRVMGCGWVGVAFACVMFLACSGDDTTTSQDSAITEDNALRMAAAALCRLEMRCGENGNRSRQTCESEAYNRVNNHGNGKPCGDGEHLVIDKATTCIGDIDSLGCQDDYPPSSCAGTCALD